MSELSFGEKAVKSTSVCPDAQIEEQISKVRKMYANAIDELIHLRNDTDMFNRDMATSIEVAIQQTQTAQMWAIKAIAQQS